MSGRCLAAALRLLALAMLLCGVNAGPGRAETVGVSLPLMADESLPPDLQQAGTDSPTPSPSARKTAVSAARAYASAATATPCANAPAAIVELARALKNNPDLIYEYVYNNIDALPQYGTVKGPVAAILDARGTAFDQAELMALLLQKAGYCDARVEVGTASMPATQLTSWLNVDDQINDVQWALAAGGFPTSTAGGSTVTSATIGWAWVRATINGSVLFFDPSTKVYRRSAGWGNAALATAMGYSSGNFTTAAEAGAQIVGAPTPSVTGLNNDAIVSQLRSMAGSLVNQVGTQTTTDVIGGRAIVPLAPGGHYGIASRPGSYSTEYDPGTSASPYRASILLNLPNSGSQGISFNSSDIYGHALYVYFDRNNAPQLWLDQSLVLQGSSVPAGSTTQVYYFVSYPGQSNTFGTPAVATLNLPLSLPGMTYAISTSWGPVGRGMVENQRKLLQVQQAAVSTPPPSGPYFALAQSLTSLGLTWLAEVSRVQELVDQFDNTLTVSHNVVGVVGLRPSGTSYTPYLDFFRKKFVPIQIRNRSRNAITPAEATAYEVVDGFASALEAAVVEDTQPGVPPASMTRLFSTYANGTFYDINNNRSADTNSNLTYYNTYYRPQMAATYNAQDLGVIDTLVGSTYSARVIAPLKGAITIGTWTGTGYMPISQPAPGWGTFITGTQDGGAGGGADGSVSGTGSGNSSGTVGGYQPGTDDGSAGLNVYTSITQSPDPSAPSVTVPSASAAGSGSCMPVPTLHGGQITCDLQQAEADISTGRGGFPYELSFIRTYDSSRIFETTALGRGWTHNFDIRLLIDGDAFEALGENSPASGSTGIAAVFAAVDQLKAVNDLVHPVDRIVIAALIEDWFGRSIKDNVRTVVWPQSTERFVALPSGTYSGSMQGGFVPPLGSSVKLTAGASQSHTYVTKDQQVLNFDSGGHLTSWNFPSGVTVTLGYDSSKTHALTSINNNLGQGLTVGTAGGGGGCGVTSVANSQSSSRSALYFCTPNGNLFQASNPVFTTTYHYDGNNRLSTISKPGLTDAAVTYDSFGRVASHYRVGANNTQIAPLTFLYAGMRSEIDDALGNTHVTYFDQRARPVIDIDSGGNTMTLEYDGRGRQTKATLPEGNGSTFTYDNFDNVLTETNFPKPSSGLTARQRSFTYDSTFNGVHTSTEFGGGNLTTFDYDHTTGSLLRMTQSPPKAGDPNPVITLTYNGFGQMTSKTEPPSQADSQGRVTLYGYDPANLLSSVTVDSNHLALNTTFTNNAVSGDIAAARDPSGHSTTYVYDGLHRLTSVTPPSPAGQPSLSTIYDYQDGPLLRTITRASGSANPNQVTSFAYSPSGKLGSRTDASGDVVSYHYDAADRLDGVTDQEGYTTSYGYGLDGRLNLVCRGKSALQVGQPCLGQTWVEQRFYAPNGVSYGREHLSAGAWQSTIYTADGFDRMSSVRYPDNSFEQDNLATNGDLRSRVSRAGITTSWSYDTLHRPLTRTGSPTVNYAYDLAGNLLSATVPATAGGVPVGTWSFGYDTAGRRIADTGPLGTLSFGFDSNGNRTSVTYPDGKKVRYFYDVLNHLTSVNGVGNTANAVLWSDSYDPFDRLASRTEGSNWSTTFTFDNGGAGLDLLKVVNQQNTRTLGFTYSYDQGHRVTKLAVPSSLVMVHPSAANTLAGLSANADNQLLNPAPGQTLSYIADGHLAGDGTRSYGYDPEGVGRILTATQGSTHASYLHDPWGHRIAKTVGGVTTQYLVDRAGREWGEYDGSGNLLRRLLYDRHDTAPVAILDPAGTPSFNQFDRLGSVVVSGDGATLGNTFAYLPYGETASGTLAGTAFGYAGYRFDAETATYHTRTRSYDPRLGRFLQTDPIGQAGGLNVYGYVGGNPLGGTDPGGTAPSTVTPYTPRATTLYVSTTINVNYACDKASCTPMWRQTIVPVILATVPSLGSYDMKLLLDGFCEACHAPTPSSSPDSLAGNVQNAINDAVVATVGRPPGIPDSFTEKPSDKNGGMIYSNPDKPQYDNIRVMPGNPNSSNPAQQGPYVKDQIDGRFLTKDGTRVQGGDNPDAHIPLQDYGGRPSANDEGPGEDGGVSDE